MKATIEVTSREEADLLRAGLADATARAMVKITGALATLPDDKAKRRVLLFITDSLSEPPQ